jgi:hypothetical protein
LDIFSLSFQNKKYVHSYLFFHPFDPPFTYYHCIRDFFIFS